MRTDDVLDELRAWRDEFARSHGYDVHAMVEMLRELDSAPDRKIIHGSPRPPVAGKIPNHTLQQSGGK